MSDMLLGVFGIGGLSREVVPVARESLSGEGGMADFVFIDKSPNTNKVNGIEVFDYETFKSHKAKEKSVVIAIANSQIRGKIFIEVKSDGLGIYNVKHPNVVIMDSVVIGEGYILSPFVTLTSNITIGTAFQANLYSYVGHDCTIGDFVTFAPNVHCNGNVTIEDHAYIGTGAIIKQGRPGKPLTVGKGAIVGMGAVVTKDVPPGVTVIGNPAKPLSRSALRGER